MSREISVDSFDEELGRGLGTPHWQLGTSSNSRSFEIESWCYVSHKNYDLQLLQQKEPESSRPKVPATLPELLSFFRCNATAIYRTQIISMCHMSFNSFLWYHIDTTLIKTLPTNYIYYFLSTYAPEDHLYIHKMCPLFLGFKWLVVLCGVIDLLLNTEMLVILMDYTLRGIFQSAPWNRCDKPFTKTKEGIIMCYDLAKFKTLIATYNTTFWPATVILHHDNGTWDIIELSAITYLRGRLSEKDNLVLYRSYYCVYFIVIWCVASLFQRQIYKRAIWKVLNNIHWIINAIMFGIAVHLIIANIEGNLPKIKYHQASEWVQLKFDLDMLSTTTIAPPLIHFFVSRSNMQINPARDCSIMMFSNSVYYIIKGIIITKLKYYLEGLIMSPVELGFYNPLPIFFLYPIYFNMLYLGDVYTCIFFIFVFLQEYLTFVITYHCLLEVVMCEWPKLSRWVSMAMTTLLCFYIFCSLTSSSDEFKEILLSFYSKGIPALIEAIIVIYVYPLDRLLDDITFHFGSPPSLAVRFCLRYFPIFYAIKLYAQIYIFFYLTEEEKEEIYFGFYWIWLLFILPIVFGVIYVVLKTAWRPRGMEWASLFRPSPLWGPRDHIKRQLRKQFDSREYVRSISSRYLSRYLTSKAMAQTYRLDINYQKRRRTTIFNNTLTYAHEKKTV